MNKIYQICCGCVALLVMGFSHATTIQVLDSANHPVADAVVYLTNGAPMAVKPGTAEIQQKNRQFMPLVSVVQTGAAVSFPNNDLVRHHVYSFSPTKPFQIKLYAGKPEAPIVFDKPGTVVIGCNIHDNMIAYLQVVDTPYFAKTDASGMAKITNAPAGKYILKTWHYKQNAAGTQPHEQAVTIKDDDNAIVVKLDVKI